MRTENPALLLGGSNSETFIWQTLSGSIAATGIGESNVFAFSYVCIFVFISTFN